MKLVSTLRSRPLFILLVAVIVLYTVLYLFPLLWMVLSSFKTRHELYQYPPTFLPENWSLSNYTEAWSKAPWPAYFRNTAIIGLAVATGKIFIAGFAGFGFSKAFRGDKLLFMLVLGTMMIPSETTLISNYVIMHKLHWLDTYLPLIVPALTSAFSIFLYRQFYKTVPQALEDAAAVDGCVEWDYYFRIAFPVGRAVTVIVWLLAIIDEWNSYLWPLLVISKDNMRVLQTALFFFQDDAGPQQNLIMAACTFVSVPIVILFFIFQRQLMSGVVTSGIKG
jgi:multiple sugar transport system permease protein